MKFEFVIKTLKKEKELIKAMFGLDQGSPACKEIDEAIKILEVKDD